MDANRAMSDTTKQFLTIGIDGGAASGKSSTSRRLASTYGLLHVDTGSHYRALAASLLAAGISPLDETAVQEATKKLDLSSIIADGSAHIMINGQRPEASDLRSDAVNANVSKFAAMPSVRAALKDYQRTQRDVARDKGFNGLIMEGRDIGSVILPDADLLFFLEADAATRAARREAEGQQDAVAERDKMDSNRKTAPLTCPPRARRIDTGAHSLEDVIKIIGVSIEAKGLAVA